jgi:hypothetical protein
MSGERRYTRSELKRYGIVLVVLLVALGMRNPVRRGHRFRCKADSIPVIADSA